MGNSYASLGYLCLQRPHTNIHVDSIASTATDEKRNMTVHRGFLPLEI